MKRVIILHNIRSLLNVGSVFRTADGAGWDMIYLSGFTPTPPRKEISKTALGAESWVKWEYYVDIFELIEKLRKEKYAIVSIETGKDSFLYDRFEVPENLAVIMGNEIGGIDQGVLDASDAIIELPMLGKKVSLNVSVTAGIIMYAYRKR